MKIHQFEYYIGVMTDLDANLAKYGKRLARNGIVFNGIFRYDELLELMVPGKKVIVNRKVNIGSMGNKELSRLSQRAIGSNGLGSKIIVEQAQLLR